MRLGITLLLLILSALGVSAQSSGLYWYIDGIADYWFVQRDVFAFRCINGQAFTGSTDPNVVDSIYHHANRQDQAVEVYFSQHAQRPDNGSSTYSRFWSGGDALFDHHEGYTATLW